MKTFITTLAPRPKSLRRVGRVPCLILLTVVFFHPPVPAQTTAQTSPTSGIVPEDPPTKEYLTAKDVIDQVRFSVGSTTHYYNSLLAQSDTTVVFFPPVPPPLEAEIPLLPPYASGVPASPELAAFVGDLFYPLLATRLASNDLPKGTRAELQGYRAAKLDLQNELQARIAALKDTAPAQQEKELAAFAALQAPRILALETAAEKIRGELLRTGLFGLRTETKNWPALAGPAQPPARDAGTPDPDLRLETKAMRGAAFFQEGLSPALRRLLLEAVVEQEALTNPNLVTNPTGDEGWLLHFSPETASIRLVTNLPAPLAKKISEYVSAKATLKSQLREALLTHATSSQNSRTAAMQELSDLEAPRLAALEPLAEEIRRELATLPNQPGPPVLPNLPPELAARISTYRAHKLELLKTLYAMLVASAKPGSPVPAEGPARSGATMTSALPWLRDSSSQTAVTPANLRVSTDEFNSTQTRLLGELNKEQAGIREALAEYFRTTNQPMDRKSINDLLKDFETSRQKQEMWDRYRGYQTAVLMPGLSPEQRRLLFDAAVQQLALPLPAGERTP
jgi:hypothetical protein